MPIRTMLAALLATLALLTAPPPARGQTAEYTGTFHIVWGVPPEHGPQAVNVRYWLADAAGRMTELLLDEELLRPLGGPLAVDRRPVAVTGTPAPAPRPGGAGEGEPVLRVAAIRRAAAGGAAVSADTRGAGRSGTHRYVTILCKFADSPGVEPETKATYQSWMTGGYPSLDHYWREVSANQIDLAGSVVVGWYVLPRPRSQYLNALGSADLNLLAADCTAAADPDVAFTDFFGVNMQFNQELDGYSWGGSRVFALDGQSKLYGTTWMAEWAGQSVYVHESGHSLGLPHSSGPYSATYDSKWDVMSNAYAHFDGAHGTYVGQHTVGYHRDLLAWVPAGRKLTLGSQETRTTTLQRAAFPGADGHLLAQIPIGATDEFYTVEARARVGLDAHIPGDAVVIHRVNPFRSDRNAQVVDADANGDVNDEGAMWRPGETFRDEANGITVAVGSATATGFSVTLSRLEVAITSAAARPAAMLGVPYADQLQATGGSGSYSWTVTGGTLPLGVVMSAGGALSGTPQQVGAFSFTARVASGGANATRTFSLQVLNEPVVTSDPVRPAGVVGSPYADTLRSVGGTGTRVWSLTGGALPGGLALAASGAVTGTPTESGTFQFTATVAAGGRSAGREFRLQVHPPLEVASDTARAHAVVGAAYDDVLEAAGGPGGYAWSLAGGELPPGLELSAEGRIAGTPTQPGTYRPVVAVRSGGLEARRTLVVVVHPVLVVRSDSVRRVGVMGAAYADTLAGEGGPGPVVWSLTGGSLPEGVALNPSGALSGVPSAAGTFHFTATAASGPLAVTRGFSVEVTHPVLPVDAVVEQLLGTGALTADQVRYLDLQGNRNGRLDVGDVRAWLRRNNLASPVPLPPQ